MCQCSGSRRGCGVRDCSAAAVAADAQLSGETHLWCVDQPLSVHVFTKAGKQQPYCGLHTHQPVGARCAGCRHCGGCYCRTLIITQKRLLYKNLRDVCVCRALCGVAGEEESYMWGTAEGLTHFSHSAPARKCRGIFRCSTPTNCARSDEV